MSSERASQAPSFRTGTAEFIRCNVDALSLVPDGWINPSEDMNDEVYDATFALIQNLADRRAAETRMVDDSPVDGNDGSYNSPWKRHREYRITERTRELVDTVLENRDAMMPCGHSGLHNRGDHFECSFELCDRKADREELNV